MNEIKEALNFMCDGIDPLCISNVRMLVDWCSKNDWLGNNAYPQISKEKDGPMIVKWDYGENYHTILIEVYTHKFIVYDLHCNQFVVEKEKILFNQDSEKKLGDFLRKMHVIKK